MRSSLSCSVMSSHMLILHRVIAGDGSIQIHPICRDGWPAQKIKKPPLNLCICPYIYHGPISNVSSLTKADGNQGLRLRLARPKRLRSLPFWSSEIEPSVCAGAGVCVDDVDVFSSPPVVRTGPDGSDPPAWGLFCC